MYFSETQYFLRTIDHPHKLLISHLLPYFNVVIMDLHLFHAISPIKVTRKLTLNIGEGGCEHLLTNFIKTYKF